MSKKGNPGANSLANTLLGMVDQRTDKPLIIDFGTILPDYSLKTNTYGPPIPQGDYSICRSITYDPQIPLTKTYVACGHCPHWHYVVLPRKMWCLQPGERVLVVWVDNEAVIVDILYNGTKRW